MDVEHDVGPRQVEQVGVAGDLAWMVGEALAAVVRVLEPGALEHRPPRTVEHDDPLVEQLSQPLFCAQTVLFTDMPKEGGSGSPELFRRFLAWSPSCLSKLSRYGKG